MTRQKFSVGLDVGTTKTAICVGQLQEGLVQIIGTGLTPTSGMRKGVVVDIEECVSSISAALEQAEHTAGLPLEEATVGLGGAHIQSSVSKGVIAVSKADGEVTSSDIDRVIQAAQAVALPPNREILHVIPRQYLVDGQDGIKDPIGMTAVRLETEAIVIGGSSTAIRHLTKCVNQAGLKIQGLLFNGLATARSLLSNKQRELGVLVIDIGGGTTTLTIFEEGDIIYANVLPIGSVHITNDLAIGLRTSVEIAEQVKIKHGCALASLVKEVERIDLSKIDPEEDQKIERKIIVEIIEARLKELINMVDEQLKTIGKSGLLPAGVVLTGGGSLIDGLVDLVKYQLQLPCRVGLPTLEIGGLVDKIDSPVYAAAVGLMLEGLEQSMESRWSSSTAKNQAIGDLPGRFKKLLKHFLP